MHPHLHIKRRLKNLHRRVTLQFVDPSVKPLPRRRLPGIDLRPGALKTARNDAGLSLGQLAAGKISRTALHLMEAGRSRATLPTLAHIAQMTGKPIGYFVAPGQQRLILDSGTDLTAPEADRVRILLARGRFDEVVQQAEVCLDHNLDQPARAHVQLALGVAQLQLLRPQYALQPLMEALRYFEGVGDHWAAVDCRDWLAAASQHTQSPEALAQAHRALEECCHLDPVPPHLLSRILGRLGGIYASNHRWTESIRAYEAGIEAAGGIRDLPRMAKVFGDLGNAYGRLNDLVRAREYATKALAISQMLGYRASVAQMENNLAALLVRAGDYGVAREHLERSLSICEEMGIEHGKANVLLSLASLDLTEERLESATAYLDKAIELTSGLGELSSLAEARQLLAHVAHHSGDPERTDREFQAIFTILEQMGVPKRLTEAHAAYANILEERGATAAAIHHWRLAVAASASQETGTGSSDL